MKSAQKFFSFSKLLITCLNKIKLNAILCMLSFLLNAVFCAHACDKSLNGDDLLEQKRNVVPTNVYQTINEPTEKRSEGEKLKHHSPYIRRNNGACIFACIPLTIFSASIVAIIYGSYHFQYFDQMENKYCNADFPNTDSYCMGLDCLVRNNMTAVDYMNCKLNSYCWNSPANPYTICLNQLCEDYQSQCTYYENTGSAQYGGYAALIVFGCLGVAGMCATAPLWGLMYAFASGG